MPESRSRTVEFHRHQKPSINCLRRASNPAPDASPGIIVLKNKPCILGKVFRTDQQRPVIVHVRTVGLDCFWPAWNLDVQFHRDAKHHTLAAPPFVVRRGLRSVILVRVRAVHPRKPTAECNFASKSKFVPENAPAELTAPIPKNPFPVGLTLPRAPSHRPACSRCKPQPRQSSAGLSGS